MTISQLIAHLERIKVEHGDLECWNPVEEADDTKLEPEAVVVEERLMGNEPEPYVGADGTTYYQHSKSLQKILYVGKKL